jgi:hypothetical protein
MTLPNVLRELDRATVALIKYVISPYVVRVFVIPEVAAATNSFINAIQSAPAFLRAVAYLILGTGGIGLSLCVLAAALLFVTKKFEQGVPLFTAGLEKLQQHFHGHGAGPAAAGDRTPRDYSSNDGRKRRDAMDRLSPFVPSAHDGVESGKISPFKAKE